MIGASAAGIALTNLGTGSGSPANITTIASVPAGSLIIVGVYVGAAVPTDTVGNTYHLAKTVTTPGNNGVSLYYAYNCLALPSGDTISISAGIGSFASAAYTRGVLATSNPLDQAVGATGTSTAPTTTSTTPAETGELWIGVVATDSSVTLTQASGYSTPLNTPDAGFFISGNKVA